jgi:hypothetical protein
MRQPSPADEDPAFAPSPPSDQLLTSFTAEHARANWLRQTGRPGAQAAIFYYA